MNTFLARLSIPINMLNQFTGKMEGASEEKKKTIVMTIIVLILLEKLPGGGENICEIIEQAKQWLGIHALTARIDGKPVKEVLESNLDFEKLIS